MDVVLINLQSLGICYGVLSPEVTLKNTPTSFLEFCQKMIEGCSGIQKSDITKNKARFAKKELEILQKAFEIGKMLGKKIPENKTCAVDLVTQESNDLKPQFTVNGHKFVFVNRGVEIKFAELHRFLNILSGAPKFKKNEFHLFVEFVKDEFDFLFEVIKKSLIDNLKRKSFERQERGNYFKTAFSEGVLILDINGYREYIEDFANCSWQSFIEKTSPKYREGTLLRDISSLIKNEKNIVSQIESCVHIIDQKLPKLLESLDYKKYIKSIILDSLDIQSVPIHYVKRNQNSLEIFELPDKTSFYSTIKIEDAKCILSGDNLEINMTVKNKEDKESLRINYSINLGLALISPTTIVGSTTSGDLMNAFLKNDNSLIN